MPDEILYIEYMNKSDNDAFRTLFERHRESLTLFLFEMLRNMDDAEDIMLDTFAVVASGTSKYKGKSSFRTWLFAIARKLALKHMYKNRQIILSMDDITEETASKAPMPDEELLKTERKKELYEALEKINPEYREALLLLYFENMSIEEVAGVMKKNRKQMYNLIERGKAALKKLIQNI